MNFLNFIKNNTGPLVCLNIVLNLCLCVGVGYLIFYTVNNPCEMNTCKDESSLALKPNAENNTKEEEKDDIYVEVKGAVNSPGVFKVSNGYVINDIIALAGGFQKDAYTKNINLSRKVNDELVIYVYTNSEYKSKNTSVKIVKEPCKCPTYDISSCLDAKSSEIEATKDTNTNTDTGALNNDTKDKLVNINTASINELTTITGIGEAKAKSIVEYRTKNGNFKNIEEIKNVSGIGDALFAKIKSYITV